MTWKSYVAYVLIALLSGFAGYKIASKPSGSAELAECRAAEKEVNEALASCYAKVDANHAGATK